MKKIKQEVKKVVEKKKEEKRKREKERKRGWKGGIDKKWKTGNGEYLEDKKFLFLHFF